eukprot:5419628-Ditylum_brightwellii.AAC.1
MDSIMAQEDAEEGHFYWDESNEEVIETVKEARRDDGKEKWHKVDTVNKRKATTGKWGASNGAAQR